MLDVGGPTAGTAINKSSVSVLVRPLQCIPGYECGCSAGTAGSTQEVCGGDDTSETD